MKTLRRLAGIFALTLIGAAASTAQIENEGSLNTWTVRRFSRAHDSSNQSTYIKTVRAARQKGFDRVVFEFDGPLPNYRLEYLKTPFYESEGGRERIRQPGRSFLLINLFLIPVEDKQLKFSEAKEFVPRGDLQMRVLRSVKDKVFFEGYYDFLVGVRLRRPFRVTELANPARVVVDFKH